MNTTRTVNVAVCGACGRERLSNSEREPVPGYAGAITYCPPDGKHYDIHANFFACTKKCISRAMHTAIDSAVYAELGTTGSDDTETDPPTSLSSEELMA